MRTVSPVGCRCSRLARPLLITVEDPATVNDNGYGPFPSMHTQGDRQFAVDFTSIGTLPRWSGDEACASQLMSNPDSTEVLVLRAVSPHTNTVAIRRTTQPM